MYLIKIIAFWERYKVFYYNHTIVLTKILVRSQNLFYITSTISVNRDILILSLNFEGHLVADLQQHRAQSVLGWVTV